MLSFSVTDNVARLQLDDGKANAVGHAFIDSINEGLDRASEEAKAVVISGRTGVFSAGFDLKELEKGPDARIALVGRGAKMLLRVFTHPQPVVAGCSGHAIAAGAFLLLACDTRIGACGDFKIGLNETAIGMSLPVFGLELAKARLSKRHLTSAATQSRLYAPTEAVDAGFLDQTAAAEELEGATVAEAARLSEFSAEAYAANKMGIRQSVADVIKASLQSPQDLQASSH